MTVFSPGRDVDVAIVGGLGHVGLPLGIMFATKGLRTILYDVDAAAATEVRKGVMPFLEYGADELLKQRLTDGSLIVSTDPAALSRAKHVIVAIGTPIDEYLNPKTRAFIEALDGLRPHLAPDQTIIIRSTVYPRTCEMVHDVLRRSGPAGAQWLVAYCPERIIQGHAIEEIPKLPQLVAGVTPEAAQRAASLFEKISPKVIEVSVGEAELTKLFSNAWRYIQFATTNQFYMMARKFGVDYNRVRDAMTAGYERAQSLPRAGFAAGPCLLKDTMQLAAFNTDGFLLGHAAMMVNEGLPNFLVQELAERHDLKRKKVGILGMAFKADIDDVRDSLSFKLGKILRFHGADVHYSDEFAKNPDFVPKETIVETCDIIIVAVPHSAYRNLAIPASKDVVDLWDAVRRQ